MEKSAKNKTTDQWLALWVHLSKRHMELTVAERWDACERVVQEKMDICRRLERCRPVGPDSAVLIDEVRRLDARVLQVLKEKRSRTVRELGRIPQTRKAVRHYAAAGETVPRRHFGITC